jgi:hypothetical protein
MMLTKSSGKMILGGVMLMVLFSLLWVSNLNSKKDNKIETPLELVDVEYHPCFSPDGDGVKDEMVLSARFKGQPGKKVFATLFVKSNYHFICVLAGQGTVSTAGEALVSITWNGKDWKQQPVADGTYQLKLYYLDGPLFNWKGRRDPGKFYKKFTHHLVKQSKHRRIGKWEGEVLKDTVDPQLNITSPEDQLQTLELSVETLGPTEGGEKCVFLGSKSCSRRKYLCLCSGRLRRQPGQPIQNHQPNNRPDASGDRHFRTRKRSNL